MARQARADCLTFEEVGVSGDGTEEVRRAETREEAEEWKIVSVDGDEGVSRMEVSAWITFVL